ncbi:MAG TPA: hypothetical protein DCO79_09680 [Spirochaeta sp.]|nr:hypothetical protein [Spirochaeta sp.]
MENTLRLKPLASAEDFVVMTHTPCYFVFGCPKPMDYAARESELLVGMTDLNSPLSTAASICGYDNFFVWLYTEPEAIHDLMRLRFGYRMMTAYQSVLDIKNIGAINNSAMYDFETSGAIARKTDGKCALYIQDVSPYNVEENYTGIFNAIEDLRGKLITTFVCDNVSMTKKGSICESQNTFDVGNKIVDFVRECVDKKLSGEPL